MSKTLYETIIGDGPLALLDTPWAVVFIVFIWQLHPALGLIAIGGALVLFGLAVGNDIATRPAPKRSTADVPIFMLTGACHPHHILPSVLVGILGAPRPPGSGFPYAGHGRDGSWRPSSPLQSRLIFRIAHHATCIPARTKNTGRAPPLEIAERARGAEVELPVAPSDLRRMYSATIRGQR